MISKQKKEILEDANAFYNHNAVDAGLSLSHDFLEINDIKYNSCFKNLEPLYGQCPDSVKLRLYRSSESYFHTCLILIHGYGTRNKKTYQQLGERFAARGVDSLVYTLPFHLERSVDKQRLNNPSFDFIFEIYRQSIVELKKLVNYLKNRGYSKVGCLGFSFGGYCCSLLAAVETNVDFVIPMASLGDLGPIKSYLEKRLDNPGQIADYDRRLNQFLAQNYLHLISPIYFNPVIPKDNILFIQGLLDSRTPLREVQKFREKWNWPPVVWYPCDHLTFILFNRITLLVAARFIKKVAAASK